MVSKKLEMIKALRQFAEAYQKLVEVWNTEDPDGPGLNDVDAAKAYPFEKHFDEYNVSEWVDESIKELEEDI
jgi:hypothetical protein